MEERLQKIMAQAGIGSRRKCEELIAAGRVTVNVRTAVLGERADAQRDRIQVDGQSLRTAEAPVYIALYKPRGVISAVSGPDPRPTVRSLVDLPQRMYPVGRLDFDSEGLILLTNDGELANRLTHPRYGHEKEYRVLVASRPDPEQLQTWRRGVVLEDGYRTQPADVRFEQPYGRGAWLRIILKEGRKRQIRETGAQIGLPVVKIIRVRIGNLTLGSLSPGNWRYLTPDEVRDLLHPEARSAAQAVAAPPAAARRSTDKPPVNRSARRTPGGAKPAAARRGAGEVHQGGTRTPSSAGSSSGAGSRAGKAPAARRSPTGRSRPSSSPSGTSGRSGRPARPASTPARKKPPSR